MSYGPTLGSAPSNTLLGVAVETGRVTWFRDGVQQLIESEPSIEEVDAFLSGFEGLMQTPVVLH